MDAAEFKKRLAREEISTRQVKGLEGRLRGIESSAPVWGSIAGTLSAQTDLSTALGGKVDKVTGKGLSTEDYSTAEQSKLSGIAAGAEVNVNADWDAVTGDAQIMNKPTSMTPTSHDNSAHSTAFLAESAFSGLTKITVATNDPGGSDGDLWVDLP